METGNANFVIDKEYTFFAVGPGMHDEVILRMQCTHEDTMGFGEYFYKNHPSEIDFSFDEKYRLDEVQAQAFAESLFQEYKEEHDDLDFDEDGDAVADKSVDDFSDQAYELLSVHYTGYEWSEEFKIDCINYYMNNK